MTTPNSTWRRTALCIVLALAGICPATHAASAAARGGDHIVAVINQELVTAGELERRVAALRSAAGRAGQGAPSDTELRKRALDELVDERVLVTHARDAGWRIEETDLDRAVQSVAAQNQLTLPQLVERLALEGLDLPRFRAQLRDQIAVERTREREVAARILIGEDEVEQEIQARRDQARLEADLNLAQILVPVPEGADAATMDTRRQKAQTALQRLAGGEPFDAVARELSDDANRERGGEIGTRPASRYPDLFVDATRSLEQGQYTTSLVRSGAGFHILKVLAREDVALPKVVETRARHILLRTSEQATPQTAARRLMELRAQVESGARRFEDVAREVSEDASAAQGGDLGWFRPGVMVPEFEQPMNALPVGGLSQPVLSRFGVHLIEVVDRRQVQIELKELRQQIRNELRERKFAQSFEEWMDELRARAYVEFRGDPGQR